MPDTGFIIWASKLQNRFRLMRNKRILIIDEYGFSRVCSALLDNAGYDVTITSVSDLPGPLNEQDYGLIVTSHPYGAPVFNELGKIHTPTLILADNIDDTLIQILNTFDSSYCMIKPLDYKKFKLVVKDLINSGVTVREGYSIV
jgi:hypothetical protein